MHTPSVRAVTLSALEPKASAAWRPRAGQRILGESVEGGTWLPGSPKAVFQPLLPWEEAPDLGFSLLPGRYLGESRATEGMAGAKALM